MLKSLVAIILLAISFTSEGTTGKRIEGIYHGASAFIANTAIQHEDPRSVESLEEYLNVFGIGIERLEFFATTLGVKAFFENGGEKVFIINPSSEEESIQSAFSKAIEKSKTLAVDLVAAPAASFLDNDQLFRQINRELISSVENSPRFALLDAPESLFEQAAGVKDALIDLGSSFETNSAALFAPWATSFLTLQAVPTSFIAAGVMTRVDKTSGIYKPAAGPRGKIQGVTALLTEFSPRVNDELNQAGVNLLREIESLGGFYIWGARTLSSENYAPYIAPQRFKSYLQHSIQSSLGQFDLDEREEAIRGFLYDYWRKGALQGRKDNEAFFVRCHTEQEDGCDIGVSLMRPAEFMIFSVK